MTQPAKGKSKIDDTTGKPQIGDRAAAITAHSITYGTDDPGLTAADATAIADGDAAIVLAEMLQLGTDLSAKVNAIIEVLEGHGLLADN